MIISASRRSDIPAFHSKWLMECIRKGEVLVPNPFNPGSQRQVSLKPADVDCLVFWTRNPSPMLPFLPELKDRGFPVFFMVTINGYGKKLEPGVLPVERQIAAFQDTTQRVPSGTIVWRYDPVILTSEYTPAYHLQQFERICSSLRGLTNRCITSFVHPYRKCLKKLKEVGYEPLVQENQISLLREMNRIASAYGITLQTCAADPSLQASGVLPGSCIDIQRIEEIITRPLVRSKDKNQRPECLCQQSIDIGAYGTCKAGCIYCYAR